MNNCPTCGKPNDPPTDTATRTYVKIPSWEAFRDLCSLLRNSPNCTDLKFQEAIESFPQTLARYGQLTTGQWKFFSVIHKKVFETWPPPPDQLVLQANGLEPLSPLPDEEFTPF